MTEKELVRSFGQWSARWDIGFFGMEDGTRYYIDDPDNLLGRFRLLAQDNLELCLSLWREFDTGYCEVMSKAKLDCGDEEEEEGYAPWCYWLEPDEREPEEVEHDTRTEQVYNSQSWQFCKSSR